jgi:hypothetical protein
MFDDNDIIHKAEPDDRDGREDSAVIALTCFAVMVIIVVASWAARGCQ